MPTLSRPATIVVASLLAGLLSALALVAGPFADGSEAQVTGALLLGFAAGWAATTIGWSSTVRTPSTRPPVP